MGGGKLRPDFFGGTPGVLCRAPCTGFFFKKEACQAPFMPGPQCCTPEVNRSYVVARTPTDALRLDAADGVLDGAHYGAPIVSRPVCSSVR